MALTNRCLPLVLVLQVACSAPLDSQNAASSGGAGGGTVGTGSADAALGGGGGIVFTLPGGGSSGSGGAIGGFTLPRGGSSGSGGVVGRFTQIVNPGFDPSVLVYDAGVAVDSSDPPSTGIVIFDRSGSMSGGWTTASTDDPDSAVTVTKWVAASRALIGSLTPVQDRVTLGAILFPSDGACGVAPLTDSVQFAFMPARQFIQQYIERSSNDQPGGNTPLTMAFEVADQAIQSLRSQGLLQGRFFVMLLTDGEPNCELDMTKVLALASGWLAQGIQTYVFGLPGSESAHVVLDSIAQAGGTQTIAVPGSSGELESGMAAVY